MKTPTLIHSLVDRVSDRLSPLSTGLEAEKQSPRALALEILEPRVLFSGSPVPAPAPESEPAPVAQEAPAPEETSAPSGTSPDTTVTAVAAPPEASEPQPATEQGNVSIPLSDAEVQALVAAASQRWIDSGLSADQTVALDSVNYVVGDLGGNYLGAAEGNTVFIDDDAAGQGWFIDATPMADEEFGAGGIALDGGDGGSTTGVDLLSILLHEQGHILGLDHVEDRSQAGDVMFSQFDVGERRGPVASQAEGAIAGSLEGIHFASLPYSGADLTLWLRADNTDGLTLDTINFPNRVITWADETGIGGNVVAQDGTGPGGQRPLWQDNQVNGLPALWFDTTARRIIGDSFLSGGDARTIFVVAESNSPANSILFDPNGQGTGATLFRMTPEVGVRFGNGNELYGDPLTGGYGIFAATLPAGGTIGDTEGYRDGPTSITPTGSSNPGNAVNTGTDGYQAGSGGFTGYIAEIIAFDALLTPEELNAVGYYLQDKYAITGSFTAPVPTDVHWDNGSVDTSGAVTSPFSGTDLWNENVNWRVDSTPGAQNVAPNDVRPGQLDQVFIALNDTESADVPARITAGDNIEVSTVRIGGNFGLGTGGDGILNVEQGGALTVTGTGNGNGNLALGQDPRDGKLNISTGGSVTVANGGQLVIGFSGTGGNDLSQVTLSDAASALTVSGQTQVATGGRGQLIVNDGTADLEGGLLVGGLPNTGSNYRGLVNQNGGAVTVTGDLEFGGAAGREGGTYNLNTGTLTVTGNIVETASNVDSAQLHLNGGTLVMPNGATTSSITVQRFSVAETTGTNVTYTANAPITTTGTLAVGGFGNAIGSMIIDDGTFAVNATNAALGQGGTADGTLTVSGTGEFNVTGGDFHIAGDGTGGVDSGTKGAFILGSGGDAPTASVSGGNTEVGTGGMGTFTLNSGTFTQLTNNFVISQDAAATGTTTVNGGMLDITNDLNMNAGTSTLNVDGGTVTITGNLNQASGSGNSTITVTSGTLSAASIIDRSGTSTINLEGGTLATSTTNISVDNFNINPTNPGGNVTYTRSGGTLTVNNDLKLGGESGNSNHRGNLTQTGGTVTVGDDLIFGGAANLEGGTYHLRGGSLNVTGDIIETVANVDSAQLYIDVDSDSGSDALTVGGNITVQSFRLGQNGGSTGTYTLTPGQDITNTGTMFVGVAGAGELTVNDAGSVITVGNRLQLAENGSSSGTINLNAGTIDVNGGGLFLAGASGGGGGANPNTTATLNIGTTGGSATDAQVFTRGANFEVGRSGSGVVVQESGTVRVETNNLILGQGAPSDGTYTLNDGTLETLIGQIRVGNTGNGVFNQNGGDVIVATTLDLGNANNANSDGTYNQTAGTLTIGAILEIGNVQGGTGAFNQGSGGIVTVTGNVLVGDDGTGAALIDGTLSAANVIVNDDSVAGDAGTLLGSGTITGNVTVRSGGILEPGTTSDGTVAGTSEIGVLTINGDFLGTAGGTLAIDFDGDAGAGAPGGHDQLVVNGAVNLNDITWPNIMPTSPLTVVPGTEFVLIDNDGTDAVIGTFAGMAEGFIIDDLGDQNVYTVSYVGGDGNDVVLLAQGPAETGGRLEGGDLVVEDIEDTSTDDRLTVTVVTDSNGGQAIQIVDPNQILGVDFATGVTRPDVHTIIVPFSAFDDLIIRTNDGQDIINVSDLTGFDQSVTVDGGGTDGAVDFINFSADAAGDTGESYDLDAEKILFYLDSSISATGGGTIDITSAGGGAEDFIGLQLRRASLSSEDGAITLVGEGGSVGNHNDGVQINVGSTITTTGGSVSISGTGTGTSGPNDGVSLVGGSDVTVGGAGTITIEGTSSGAGDSNGVLLFSGTEVTTAGGDISVAGVSGGTGARNSGIYTNGATVAAGGAGSISLDGEGGGTGSHGKGLRLTASSFVASGTGDITLAGTGGPGTRSNVGVEVGVRTSLATGSGDVTVTGEGGGTASQNTGVAFLSGSSVDSGGGITVAGTGGDGTSNNDGVSLISATLEAAGDISVTGEGAGGGNYNRGIDSTRSSIGGAGVTLTGTGTQSGGTSARFGDGVYLNRGGASAAGTLTIAATGGTGSSNNRGFYASGVTLGGTLAVTGTADAGTTGRGNSGVYILNSVLGAGTVEGTAGGGTGSFGAHMNNITGGLAPGDVTGNATDAEDELVGNFFNVLPALVLAAGADRRSRTRKMEKTLGNLFSRIHQYLGSETDEGETHILRTTDKHLLLDSHLAFEQAVEAALKLAGMNGVATPEGTRRIVVIEGEDHEILSGTIAFVNESASTLHSYLPIENSTGISVGEILPELKSGNESGSEAAPSRQWSLRTNAPSPTLNAASRELAASFGIE